MNLPEPPDPATEQRLFDLLNCFVGWAVEYRRWKLDYRERYGKEPPAWDGWNRTSAERVKLARRIEDVFRCGAPWPKMWGLRKDGSDAFWFTPSASGQTRPMTDRPRDDYCLRWNGMIWVPCRTIKERREAEYVGLLMRWPGPKPKPGEYLTTGDRARFAYRVVEVERFDEPRGTRRYTCRIWCERVDPLLVPKKATVHAMRWDARPRRRAA